MGDGDKGEQGGDCWELHVFWNCDMREGEGKLRDGILLVIRVRMV